MPSSRNPDSLARLLPGTWRLGATNFPIWLGGGRLAPIFSYEVKSTSPLVLRDQVTWTAADVEKKRLGVARWTGDGFVGRGLPLASRRWTVAGASDDGDILGIRSFKSLRMHAGVDVLIRVGADATHLRTAVATASDTLGLGHEEFASLTWLDLSAGR